MIRKVKDIEMLNRRDNRENGKTENTKVGLTIPILYIDN